MGKTGRLLWPNGFGFPNGEFVFTMVQNNNLFIIFQQPENALIDTILLKQYALTTSGSGMTYIVGLEGVGTTGYPNGLYLNSGTAVSYITNFSSLNDLKMLNINLPSGIALTASNFYALTVRAGLGVSENNCLSISYKIGPNQNNFYTGSLPYYIENNVKNTSNDLPKFGLRSSSKTYGHACYESTSSYQIRSNTNPDEVGVKFNLDKKWGNHYYISGVRLYYSNPTITNGNYSASMNIYDSDGSTNLQSSTIYFEQRGENSPPKTGTGSFDDLGNIFFTGNLAKLKTGKDYYFSFKPNDLLNGIADYVFCILQYQFSQDKTWLNNAYIDLAYRADNGPWTVDNTKQINIQFFIETVDENSTVFWMD